jgi:hypothetical protein
MNEVDRWTENDTRDEQRRQENETYLDPGALARVLTFVNGA